MTNSYISVELVKACVVLDMFKTYLIRKICSPSVIITLVFSSALFVALALQCSMSALVFLAGLIVSSCSIVLPNMIIGNIVQVGGKHSSLQERSVTLRKVM